MSLTTCSKEHCWDASLDNGWCNKHTNERIAQLEAENERLKKALRDATEYECVHAWEAPCGNCAYCVCAAALVEGKQDG